MTHPAEVPIHQEQLSAQAAITELGIVALRGAWPEDTRAQREQTFEGVIQSAHDSVLGADERDMLSLAAPYWRWRLFGQPGDPLPAAMQLVQVGSDWRPRVQPYIACGSAVITHAYPLVADGLTPLVRERSANMQQHQAELNTKADAVVAAMPIYQLLRSFVPDKASDAQPLTAVEYSCRQQEIYDHAIYAAAANGVVINRKDLETRPGYEAVRRPIAALDHEDSIYPLEDTQQDPWEKIRQLMLRDIAARHDVYYDRKHFEVTWDGEAFCIRLVTADGTEYNHETDVDFEADQIIWQVYYGQPRDPLSVPGKEYKALMAMAFTAPPPESYEYELKKAMTATRDTLVAAVSGLQNISGPAIATSETDYFETGYFDGNVMHAQLSQTPGPVITAMAFHSWGKEHAARWRDVSPPQLRRGVHFHSPEALEQLRQTAVGIVRGTMDGARLVSTGPPLADIPSVPARTYDVELTFAAAQFGAYQPLLPGYTLLAAFQRGDNQYYQYKRAAYDPTVLCGEICAPLGKSKQQSLATMCESIDLQALADDIGSREHCSAADVEWLQAQHKHSTYAYKNPAGELDGPVPFEELRRYVVDGRYHCQCTGAGHLLGHLLGAAYADDPSIEVRTVHGLTVPSTLSSSIITAAGHVQNHIYKDGVLWYVLDATPPSFAMGSVASAGEMVFPEEPDAPVKAIKLVSGMYTDFQLSSEDIVPPTPVKAIDTILEGLHDSLQAQHNVPSRTALYKKLAAYSRPDDDPTVRTLRLFWKGADHLTTADVRQVLEYTRALRASPATKRRHMGFGHYTDGVLDMLVDTLVNLHQLQVSRTTS